MINFWTSHTQLTGADACTDESCYAVMVPKAQYAFYHQAMKLLESNDKQINVTGTLLLSKVEAKLTSVEAQVSAQEQPSTKELSNALAAIKAHVACFSQLMARVKPDDIEGFALANAMWAAAKAQEKILELQLVEKQLKEKMEELEAAKMVVAYYKLAPAERKLIGEEPQLSVQQTPDRLKKQLDDLLQRIEVQKRSEERIKHLKGKVQHLLMEEKEREEKFARMDKLLGDLQEKMTACSSFFAEEEDK